MTNQTCNQHVAKTEKGIPGSAGQESASKVVLSLKRLCQRVVAKNDQANIEPKLW